MLTISILAASTDRDLLEVPWCNFIDLFDLRPRNGPRNALVRHCALRSGSTEGSGGHALRRAPKDGRIGRRILKHSAGHGPSASVRNGRKDKPSAASRVAVDRNQAGSLVTTSS